MTEEIKPVVNLQELAQKAKEANEAYEKALKDSRKAIIDEVVAKIKASKITVKELSDAFKFVEPSLEKKPVKKAEPKWQYVLNGVAIKWAGRGNPKTFPQTLKDYLKQKNITIEQFKADPRHKINLAK